MSYTADDINTLETAAQNTTSRVEYNDRSVQYRSVKELQAQLALAIRAVNKTNLAAGGTHLYSVGDWS